MWRFSRLSTVVLTSSANQEVTVPLYLEILDGNSSVADSAARGARGAGVVESWTSTTTGEQVRLVDSPEVPGAASARVQFARILFY